MWRKKTSSLIAGPWLSSIQCHDLDRSPILQQILCKGRSIVHNTTQCRDLHIQYQRIYTLVLFNRGPRNSPNAVPWPMVGFSRGGLSSCMKTMKCRPSLLSSPAGIDTVSLWRSSAPCPCWRHIRWDKERWGCCRYYRVCRLSGEYTGCLQQLRGCSWSWILKAPACRCQSERREIR